MPAVASDVRPPPLLAALSSWAICSSPSAPNSRPSTLAGMRAVGSSSGLGSGSCGRALLLARLARGPPRFIEAVAHLHLLSSNVWLWLNCGLRSWHAGHSGIQGSVYGNRHWPISRVCSQSLFGRLCLQAGHVESLGSGAGLSGPWSVPPGCALATFETSIG